MFHDNCRDMIETLIGKRKQQQQQVVNKCKRKERDLCVLLKANVCVCKMCVDGDYHSWQTINIFFRLSLLAHCTQLDLFRLFSVKRMP